MSNQTYTLGRPAGNLTPAQNRPSMTINNDSSAALWIVDHFGFNDNLGGEHKQVTFPSNLPPSVPTTPPIIFVNNQDGAVAPNNLPGGLSQPFFYSGSAAQGQRNYVAANPGSTFALGGIIIKFGTFTPAVMTGDQTVSFSPAFPNAVFSVVANVINYTFNPGSIVPGFAYRTNNLSGFIINFSGSNPSVSNVIQYIAIGN